MQLAQLDYELPDELIAQEPLANREQARLLVVDRARGHFEHSRFYKIGSYLRSDDLLVLNDTRVLPARVMARKESGGRVELLFMGPAEETKRPGASDGAWICLMRSHRPPKEGDRLLVEGGDYPLRITGYRRGPDGSRRLIVTSDSSAPIEEIVASSGKLALPHYIRRAVNAEDSAAYQTVYAARTGAIAAPTAGLHFTRELLHDLETAGVRTAYLTLHIGPGTFAPLRSAVVESHTMESEWYSISAESAAQIDLSRRVGGRVIAVGTSSVRALESYAVTGDREGFTGLFIVPGFRFKLVDAMITNFHMPRSTVLALAMALAGRDTLLRAYHEAVRHRYRFLSYGDAMLIL